MKKRIVLVDDESSIRRSISLGLGQEGYEVEPCENGIDALKRLELLEKNGVLPMSIILDIKLPDIDGIKLGKIIQARYPQTPMIYITGYADKVNMQEISKMNADILIEKPFGIEELTKKIRNLVKENDKLTVVPEKETTQTFSAYALAKLNKGNEFFDTYRSLYFMENVLYCDTTKGEYDVFMLIQASSEKEIEEICQEKIAKTAGVQSIEILSVDKLLLEDSINSIINIAEEISGINTSIEKGRDMKQRVCSYILLDVEKEKIEKIYPILRLDDQVVYCDYTSGRYNLVLFVHGSYFSEIDKFIDEKVSRLEGVLKMKEFPVVNLFDM
jgi:CheY-like chemotaxis protein